MTRTLNDYGTVQEYREAFPEQTRAYSDEILAQKIYKNWASQPGNRAAADPKFAFDSEDVQNTIWPTRPKMGVVEAAGTQLIGGIEDVGRSALRTAKSNPLVGVAAAVGAHTVDKVHSYFSGEPENGALMAVTGAERNLAADAHARAQRVEERAGLPGQVAGAAAHEVPVLMTLAGGGGGAALAEGAGARAALARGLPLAVETGSRLTAATGGAQDYDLEQAGVDPGTRARVGAVNLGTNIVLAGAPAAVKGSAATRVLSGAGIGVGTSRAATALNNEALSAYPGLQTAPTLVGDITGAALGGGVGFFHGVGPRRAPSEAPVADAPVRSVSKIMFEDNVPKAKAEQIHANEKKASRQRPDPGPIDLSNPDAVAASRARAARRATSDPTVAQTGPLTSPEAQASAAARGGRPVGTAKAPPVAMAPEVEPILDPYSQADGEYADTDLPPGMRPRTPAAPSSMRLPAPDNNSPQAKPTIFVTPDGRASVGTPVEPAIDVESSSVDAPPVRMLTDRRAIAMPDQTDRKRERDAGITPGQPAAAAQHPGAPREAVEPPPTAMVHSPRRQEPPRRPNFVGDSEGNVYEPEVGDAVRQVERDMGITPGQRRAARAHDERQPVEAEFVDDPPVAMAPRRAITSEIGDVARRIESRVAADEAANRRDGEAPPVAMLGPPDRTLYGSSGGRGSVARGRGDLAADRASERESGNTPGSRRARGPGDATGDPRHPFNARRAQEEARAIGATVDYRDPAYAKLGEAAARKYGGGHVPPGFMTGILQAERSDHGRTNENGTYSPWQLTAEARREIQRKYHFDPHASLEAAARGAVLLARESFERHPGNVERAYGEYHGSPDQRKWGPINRQYRERGLAAFERAQQGEASVGTDRPFSPGDNAAPRQEQGNGSERVQGTASGLPSGAADRAERPIGNDHGEPEPAARPDGRGIARTDARGSGGDAGEPRAAAADRADGSDVAADPAVQGRPDRDVGDGGFRAVSGKDVRGEPEPEPWSQPSPPRTLAQRLKGRESDLRALASEAGWLQVGGELQRFQADNTRPGDVRGDLVDGNERSRWVEKATWWRELQRAHPLEGNLDGQATARVIEKAIAGHRLGSVERAHVEGLLDIMESYDRDLRLDGVHDGAPWAEASHEAVAEGYPSDVDAVDGALVARASKLNEAAVDQAARMAGDDDAAFMASIRRILDGDEHVDETDEHHGEGQDSGPANDSRPPERQVGEERRDPARFSRASERSAEPADPERRGRVDAELRRFLGNWKADVEVVDGVKDLPPELRAPADTRGAFDPKTGRVWLVAENLKPGEAGLVTLHELVGHKGLRSIFTAPEMERFVEQMATHPELAARAREIRAVDPELTRGHALEEAFAERAERLDGEPPRGALKELFDRVVRHVRQGLRRLGIDAALTDAEIRDTLARSRRAVRDELHAGEEGGRYSRAATGNASPAAGAAAGGTRDYSAGGWKVPGSERAYEALSSAVREQLGKVGLANRFPESFSDNLRASAGVTARSKRIVADTMKELVKLSKAEREMVSDIIEGELQHGVTPAPHVAEAAARLSKLFEDQTDELHELGMITDATRDALRGKYLPRFYESVLSKKSEAVWSSFQREYVDGVEGRSLKGRGLFKWVAKDQVADHEQLGWKEREVAGALKRTDADRGKVMMWRDYTRAEREKMGEYRDAGARFVMGYLKTQRDVAIGRLFKMTAENPELAQADPRADWVKVPVTEIPGTPGVKRYGQVAGMYVHPDVFQHLKYMVEPKGNLEKIYLKALTMWKLGKTADNPVSHFNNIMGNLMMAHFGGVAPWEVHRYAAALKEMRQEGKFYKEMQDKGLLDTTFSAQELGELIPPGLKSGLPMEAAAETWIGHRFEQLKKWSGYGAYSTQMRRAYSAEDAFFKVMIYMKERERGATPDEAAVHTERYFFNYADIPQNIRRVRDTWSPFISYTYKALPAVARTAITQPHKIALWVGLLAGANAMVYHRIFGDQADEQERRERTELPEYMQGRSIYGTPFAVRLFNDDKTGRPRFFDTSHVIPLGDAMTLRNTMGGLPLPPVLMPSNPLMSAMESIFANRDSFTGDDVTKKSMTGAQAAEARLGVILRQIVPNAPFMPGSYSWNKLANGLAGDTDTTISYLGLPGDADGFDYRGRKQSLAGLDGAIIRSLGLKVTGVDIDEQRESNRRKAASDVREAVADYKHILRNHPTPRERAAAQQDLRDKVDRIKERLAELK